MVALCEPIAMATETSEKNTIHVLIVRQSGKNYMRSKDTKLSTLNVYYKII